jgi:hypothetical protein
MEKVSSILVSAKMVGLATVFLLMVPLVAMQFTQEVSWSPMDFLIMGVLLFGVGMVVVLALRSGAILAHKVSLILAIGTGFFMIWANLAVGLIGSGPNLGNLLYIGVLAVLVVGILWSRGKSTRLAGAMFATVAALIAHTVMALSLNMQNYPGSSVWEIIGVNLFFMIPFAVSGLLFRYFGVE